MIYLIVNIVNNKKYIGYTSFTKERRFQKHKINAKKGSNTYLHKAMRKYGFDNFEIRVLDESGTYEDETKWITSLTPEYNMTAGGEGGDTSKSPNFIKSMNDYHSKKPRSEYATLGMLGKTHKKETIEKQSRARKMHWDNLSEEEKKGRASKISGSKNPMFGKIPKNSIQIEVNGVLYNSKAEACRKLGASLSYIMKNCEVKIHGSKQKTR